jgi:hypothetical protein
MILRQGSAEYVFHWAGTEAPPFNSGNAKYEEAALGFGSEQQAILFLRRLPDLFELRRFISQRYSRESHLWRTEDLFRKMAGELVRKRVKVLKRWIPAESSPAVSAPPTKVPRKEAVDRQELAEPPTFLSNHDNDAQSQTLLDAASDGEPFCEECEKARRAAQPFTGGAAEPPEPDSLPPNSDGDAQAETLIAAARDGVPFCEECEKARQAQMAA